MDDFVESLGKVEKNHVCWLLRYVVAGKEVDYFEKIRDILFLHAKPCWLGFINELLLIRGRVLRVLLTNYSMILQGTWK